MFNYECYKRKGTVLGTCIDGFLFGACCQLPSDDISTDTELSDDEDSDEDSDKVITSDDDEDPVVTSDEYDNPVLSKSDLEGVEVDSSEDEVTSTSTTTTTTTTEASQEESDEDSSSILDSIEVPLEIDNNIPSIILGDGSVVSLESLSIKPDLYKPPESSTSS